MSEVAVLRMETHTSTESPNQKSTQGKKTRFLIILLIILICATIGVVFFFQPFQEEREKVETLRGLGRNEQEAQDVTSGINQYLQEEEALQDIDQALEEFQNTTNQ